tara:strand:- start:317 stop:1468 length:1152 start_codon:yes stop_codon:yes gene_type:complete
MNALIKLFNILIFVIIFNNQAFSEDKVKIGLVVPLSGEFEEIGLSIVNSIRLALNSIDDEKIEILPRDSKGDPKSTLKVSKQLFEDENIRVIIGPVFKSSTLYLNGLPEVTFLSFTNTLGNLHSNVISSGVNAISQLQTIIKFQEEEQLKNTLVLIPDNKFRNEIENALKKSKIKIKDKFIYNTDPTLLTSQIEKITRYPQRKQNLLDEIKRIENSDDVNKESKIEKLEKKDTLGGINFDSVIIADFDENLKSVATSLLYTDVSSKRIKYIAFNQWFDDTLLKETSLQPMYFPSVNMINYENFKKEYKNIYDRTPNQIAFLSYDLMGLVYYLARSNNFELNKNIFLGKSKFKGKIGIFEINESKITHDLNFYVTESTKFKKIF